MEHMSQKRLSQDGDFSPSKRVRLDNQEQGESAFVRVIREGGVCIDDGSPILVCSGGRVRRHLEAVLQCNSAITSEFLESLAEFLENPEHLRKSLLPMRTHGDVKNCTSDSLVKMLLGVLEVQPKLISLLFEKIPEYFDGEDENMRITDSIPRLIIGQLKWIESVCPDSKITEHVLQLILIAPVHLKREAIGALPEIIQDEEHASAVDGLMEVLDGDPDCTNAALDALSNLSLDSELLERVADKVMDLLRSASANDLPMVVRYLVQSSTPEMAESTVKALRQNLNFISGHNQTSVSSGSNNAATSESELLTFEALKSGLKFRKALVSALLSEIKKVDSPEDHCPFDLWALILVRSISDQKRQSEVDKIVRQKVSKRQFLPPLLRQSIQHHSDALRPFFVQLCHVANGLLRANDNGLASFGSELYQVLFEVFGDDFSRQEVLSFLTAHTGGGSDCEVDGALQVLDALSRTHSAALRPFVVYVKGVLDYLDNLKHNQIRRLFTILSKLGISGSAGSPDSNVRLDDEVFIHIRKLLSQPNLKHKQHGFIGAVSAIMALSTFVRPDVDEALSQSLSQGTSQRKPRADQAISLLDTVKTNFQSSDEALIFLCDELATAILDALSCGLVIQESVVQWLQEHLTDSFTERYMDDPPDEESQTQAPATLEELHPTLKVKAGLNLNGSEPSVMLAVIRLVQKCKGANQTALVALCAELRVLQAYTRAASDCLDSIDALLGCPIQVFDLVGHDDFQNYNPNEKEQIILQHFYTANWMIELLNAFWTDDAPITQAKAVRRANQLVKVMQDLDQYLEHHHVELPNLNAAVGPEQSAAQPRGGRPKAKTAEKAADKPTGKGKGKKKAKAADKSSVSSAGDILSVPLSSPQKGAGSSAASGGAVNAIGKTKLQLSAAAGLLTEMSLARQQAHCFRELDLGALQVLSFNPGAADEADQSCTSTQAAALLPAALEVPTTLALLQDLWGKVDRVLAGPKKAFAWAKTGTAAAPRRAARKDAVALVSELEPVWPAVRKQFDETSKMLGATEETMNVDEDDTAAGSALSDTMLTILAILEKVLSCPDLLGANEPSLLPVLRSFGNSDADVGDTNAAFIHTFEYLQQLVKQVPTFVLSSALVSLLNHVAERCKRAAVDAELSELALWCLKQDWPDADSKLVDKEAVTKLLRTHILLSADRMGTVETVLNELMPNPAAKQGEGAIEGYPMVTPKCFRPFYKVLLECISERFVKLESEASKMEKTALQTLLDIVFKSVDNFTQLLYATREGEDSVVFYTTLKSGGRVVTSFIKLIPMLSRNFKTHKDIVNGILKKFQPSTRTLQHICAHGKVEKDKRMVAIVPTVKKNLELLLFKVKALLDENGCVGAYWIGNLKHRNVRGEEVASQAEPDSDADGDEDGDGGQADGDGTEPDGSSDGSVSAGEAVGEAEDDDDEQ